MAVSCCLGGDRGLSVEHWEVYYRDGAIAACPMGPSSSYTLELRDIWLAFFAELADGARILDLGTGNGALPLLAKEAAASAGKHFEIHGTDLAAIDPARHVPNGAALFVDVIFHPGMRSEQLDFAPAAFDAVTGQYSLEYANVDQALTEVRRVLKPGGRAQFVLHHDQSVLVRNARQSLMQASLVLEETRILRKLRRHGDLAGKSANNQRITWATLSQAMTQLQQAAAATPQSHLLLVVLDAVRKLLNIQRQSPPAVWQREVDRFEHNLRASVRRLQDLVSVAQSVEKMDSIVAAARRLGFACEPPQLQLHAGDKLVGWRLVLSSP